MLTVWSATLLSQASQVLGKVAGKVRCTPACLQMHSVKFWINLSAGGNDSTRVLQQV